MRFPLVMIDWEDSAQPISGWAYLSDIVDKSAIRVRSVGFLIHADKSVKVLAPNLAEAQTQNAQASGVIRIPARCVVKATTLRQPT